MTKYTDGYTAEELIRYIATDYYELSYDKVRWQRDHYRQICNNWLAKNAITTSLDMLENAEEHETLDEFFNLIADEGHECAPEVLTKALLCFNDLESDPVLRAAAARAIGILSRDTARQILPEAIKNEHNTFVKAILEGVFRSVEINTDF
jgi:hypothetical protein